jgi:hypothetical protein
MRQHWKVEARMNMRARSGKSSELIVAGEMLRLGLDVYLPLVDDQAIDMILRAPIGTVVQHFDVQVKSVAGYNRVIGLKNIEAKSDNYLLILHFRHSARPDEIMYMLRDQILQFHGPHHTWGDLVLKKADRDRFLAEQPLSILAERIIAGTLLG